MVLTGVRREEYETVWLPMRRRRQITTEAFRAAVAGLERKEAAASRAAVRAREREAERMARAMEAAARARAAAAKAEAEKAALRRVAEAAKRKAVREARRKKEARDAVAVSFNITNGTDSSVLQDGLDSLRARDSIRVLLTRGSTVVVDQVVRVTRRRTGEQRESGGIWWGSVAHLLRVGDASTGNWLWQNWRDSETGKLQFVLSNTMTAERLVQAFADGVVHCAVGPLLAVWEKLVDGDVSKTTKQKYIRICRQLREYALTYPRGVPEGEAMEELGRISCHRIGIVDAFGAEYQEYNKTAKRRFYYRNVWENHLEEGGTVVGGVCEVVTSEEFERIRAEHSARREFWLMEGRGCLRSGRGAWRVENPLHDLFDEFSKSIGSDAWCVDAVRYPEVAEFLEAGCLVNSTPVVFGGGFDGVQDMKSAYAQFDQCPYYQGFMGHVQTWRSLSGLCCSTDFIRKHIGMYAVRVVSSCGWFEALGYRAGEDYVLPSVEVLCALDRGVKMDMIAACFGSTEKFTFSDKMFKECGDVKKPYAHWSGCQGSYRPCHSYSFRGSSAWGKHLISLGYEVWENDGWLRVEIPKGAVPVRHHILAFLTSYCRINMILALEKFKPENVCAVVMDAIFYRGEVPVLPSMFREKEGKLPSESCSGWYTPRRVDVSWAAMDPLLLSSCMLVGAGGSGKTESILREKAMFNNILYVVPVRALGEAKREEHGVQWTTIHKLIGADCVPWREEHVVPSVVLLDELTMIDAAWVRKAIKDHPSTMFLIAGDIDGTMAYQCRNGDGTTFSEVFMGEGLPWKHFTNDYRALDAELFELKIDIRSEMRRVYTDGRAADARKIRDWISARCKIVSFKDACEMFVAGDTWIAGTHRTNAELLKRGIVSGSYTVGRRSSAVEPGWEKRGSFTTHSFQGSTISSGKVFISINDSFEIAMIYTALSRARQFEQLVFVS